MPYPSHTRPIKMQRKHAGYVSSYLTFRDLPKSASRVRKTERVDLPARSAAAFYLAMWSFRSTRGGVIRLRHCTILSSYGRELEGPQIYSLVGIAHSAKVRTYSEAISSSAWDSLVESTIPSCTLSLPSLVKLDSKFGS